MSSTSEFATLAEHSAGVLLSAPAGRGWRAAIDAVALHAIWSEAGRPVWALRAGVNAPPLPPDLPLATAPLDRDAVLFDLPDGAWIAVGRAPAHTPFGPPKRQYAFPAPLLLYATRVGEQGAAVGFFNLADQPTSRHLRLLPGSAHERGERLETDEITTEAVRLAQVLPWFFQSL